MRFNLFRKVMASHLAVILTVIFILSGILSAVVENFLYRQKIRELRGMGEALAAEGPLPARMDERRLHRAEELLSSLDVRILRLDGEGRVTRPRSGLEGFSLDPALMDRIAAGHRVEGKDEIGRQPVTWVILPERGREGALVLFSPIEGQLRAVRQIRLSLFLAAGIALVLSLLIGGGFAGRLSKRIRGLRRATERIRGGRYDVGAPVRSSRVDELDMLARDFNAMAAELARSRAELERFEEHRRRFISDVSHELRTPLTSIRGLLEGLRSGVVDGQERDRVLSLMERETLRLIRLIKELLDLEKIRAGKVELKNGIYQAGELFEIVTEQLSPRAEEKGIRITAETEGDVRIRGDYDRLLQILVNLVQNGIQFTRHGEVRLSAAERGDHTLIRVADTGVGMTSEELERVWERFFKADPSRARSGNETGLGLAIVRQLVEAHGGRIEAESRPGEGSLFTLRLPIPLPDSDFPGEDTVPSSFRHD